VVIDVVFVVVTAFVNECEGQRGAVGAEVADFAGGVAVGDEEDIGAAAAALDIDAEALVFLFVEEGVGTVGADDMEKELMGAFGGFVFNDVEESAIVRGPGGRGDALDAERKLGGVVEILDFEGVLAEAGGVGGVGEQGIVVADFEDTEAEESVALGELIEIEEDLLVGGVDCCAAIDGVLLAFDGTGVVFEAAKGVRDAEIGLLNAAEHFVIEAGLEGFGGFEIGVGVGVFGFEIGEDAGIFFVAEPGVMVDATVGVDDVLDGFAEGERGLESGGAGFGGGGGFRGEVGRRGVGVGSHWMKNRFRIWSHTLTVSGYERRPLRKAAAKKLRTRLLVESLARPY